MVAVGGSLELKLETSLDDPDGIHTEGNQNTFQGRGRGGGRRGEGDGETREEREGEEGGYSVVCVIIYLLAPAAERKLTWGAILSGSFVERRVLNFSYLW
jgi:hypothetical protein